MCLLTQKTLSIAHCVSHGIFDDLTIGSLNLFNLPWLYISIYCYSLPIECQYI